VVLMVIVTTLATPPLLKLTLGQGSGSSSGRTGREPSPKCE